MPRASILIVMPELHLHNQYRSELERDGYDLTFSSSVAMARAWCSAQSFKAVLYDVDQDSASNALLHISELRRRAAAPIIIQGSPEKLAQLLVHFSGQNTQEPQSLDCDAMILKATDFSELRIALENMVYGRQPRDYRSIHLPN